MNAYTIPPLISSLLFAAIGVLVLQQNIKSKINVAFFMACLSTFWWQFSWALLFSTSNDQLASVLVRLGYSGIIFIPITLYHFFVEFAKADEDKIYVRLSYLIGLAFLYFNWFSEYFIKGFYIYSWGFYPKANYLHIVYLLVLSILDLRAIYLLYKQMINEKVSSIKREQTKYVLLSLAFYTFAASDFLVNYGFEYYPFGYIPILFTFITISYAITRYRLMDINVIIRKGTVYSAITLVFSLLYMSIIYGSEYLLEPIVPFNIMWITLPAIFILALFFQPISERVQEIIERNVFRKQYLADKIAKKFSDGIKELMNIDDLSTFITRAAVKVFKLKGSAIFVINEKDNKYLCLDARGSFGKYKGAFYPGEDIVIAEMKRAKKAIVKEEVRLSMEQAAGSKNGHFKKIMERLDELEAFICVPSISSKRGGEVVGFLIGGEKESGDMFSAEDISLLETFSRQASISIENALMYQAQIDEIEESMKKSRMSELGSTAAGVAHEAKNALNYINLFSQALHLKKDDKEFLKGATQSFESETERMRILMEGVVDYSSPAAIEIKDENLKQLIDECVVLVRDQAKGKNVAVEVNLDPAAVIKVDKNSIKQVFLNLFLNALDAMPKNGKLSVATDNKDGRLSVIVSDTGCGIPEAKLKKIFEPFFTTKEQGTGLGLAIVKKAVEANRGELSVESKVGVGTTFRVAFGV